MKMEATKSEIIFLKFITDKWLIFKIFMMITYKSRRSDNLIEKWARDLKTWPKNM